MVFCFLFLICFVNSWIRGFVFLMSRTGWKLWKFRMFSFGIGCWIRWAFYYLGDYGHIWSFFCFTNLVMEDQRTLRGHTDFFLNHHRFTSGFRNSLHQCDQQISFYLFFFIFCLTNSFVEIFALFFQSWSQFCYRSRFKWCIQSYIA